MRVEHTIKSLTPDTPMIVLCATDDRTIATVPIRAQIGWFIVHRPVFKDAIKRCTNRAWIVSLLPAGARVITTRKLADAIKAATALGTVRSDWSAAATDESAESLTDHERKHALAIVRQYDIDTQTNYLNRIVERLKGIHVKG